jgi:hypothetical protein
MLTAITMVTALVSAIVDKALERANPQHRTN